MKTRTIKELLELMLEHKNLFTEGLCKWVHSMDYEDIITPNEYFVLLKFIENNRPEFKWYNLYMAFNNMHGFYWACGFITPRIKWIKEQIKREDLV